MKKIAKISTVVTSMALLGSFTLPMIPAVFAETGSRVVKEALSGPVSFNVVNFPESFVIGGASPSVTIPKMTVIAGTNIQMDIYDPTYKLLAEKVSQDYVLTPSIVGEYRVVYSVVTGSGDTLSKLEICEKTLNVTKSGAYFEFAKNTDLIIPTEINSSFNGVIKLPIPVVKSTKTDKEIADAGVVIELKCPANSTASITETNGVKSFDPDKEGEYRVVYSYSLNGAILAKKTFTMNVNSTYKNDYTLNYEFKTSKPTSANIGVETLLPEVKGVNKETGEEVGVYYSITVKKAGVDVTSSVLTDGKVFKATENGDYVVSYEIKNFFGKKAESFSFTIKDVKDGLDPELFFGFLKDGTGEDAGKKVVEDQFHKLPSKAAQKNIILPAVCAKDNSNGTIKYKRQIRDASWTTTVLDEANPTKAIVLNYDAASFVGDIANYVKHNDFDAENVKFKPGEYTVIYTAVDEAGNDAVLNPKIQIVETLLDAKPVIEFSTVLNKDLILGETLVFKKPTAKDDNDTRMIVKTEYQYKGDGDAWTEFEKTDKDSYELETKKDGVLRIRVTAENDQGKTNDEFIKEINVISTDDKLAAVATINKDGSNIDAALKQDDEVIIPTMAYADANAKQLKVRVVVKNAYGKEMAVYGKEITESASTKTISGLKFKAINSGIYTISYIATDVGNNVTVYTCQTSAVALTKNPSIVDPIFDKVLINLSLGESLTLPVPSVKNGDDEKIENPQYKVVVTEATGDYDILDNGKFTPYGTGKFVLKYVITDNLNSGLKVESTEYTVEVSDTDKPVVTTSYDHVDLKLKKGASLEIVRLSATDASGIKWEDCKVEIKYNGVVYKTLKTSDQDYNYTFSNDGTYEIVYTAVDNKSKSETKTFSVYVGDTDKPVLELDEKKLLFKDVVAGSELVIDENLIKISDLTDKTMTKEKNLKIEVRNISNDVVILNELAKYDDNKIETSRTGFKYKLKEVGKYRVTFTLTDSANNTTKIEKEFTVSEKGAGITFSSETVGTILIVLSVAVLAGVVIYFVATRKKTYKKKK